MQEEKAEKALVALKKMSAPITKVKREGKLKEIPSSEVVPGDIVILETGNFVPADCRIINSVGLKIEESALTGETIPVTKNGDAKLREDVADGDMVNMAFATTTIISGHGAGVVCSTGMKTKVGQIARLILNDVSPETPIQKKLRRRWKKIRISCHCNMYCYFYNRSIKTNSMDTNVYDISGISCGSNTRRTSSNCNNFTLNWCYENGQEK